MKSIVLYLYRFLSDGVPLLLIFLPLCAFVRMLFLSQLRRKTLADRTDPVRELVMYGFFAFLILLFTQTFIMNSGQNEIKLIPFQIIISQLTDINSTSFSRRAFIFNVIGNIGIFIPVGIFIGYLFRKSFLRSTAYAFYLSLVIETVQIPLERTTDVDDLLLNTAGAAIGYLIYRVICRRR